MVEDDSCWITMRGVEGVSCERFSADYAAAMGMNRDREETESRNLVGKRKISPHIFLLLFLATR